MLFLWSASIHESLFFFLFFFGKRKNLGWSDDGNRREKGGLLYLVLDVQSSINSWSNFYLITKHCNTISPVYFVQTVICITTKERRHTGTTIILFNWISQYSFLDLLTSDEVGDIYITLVWFIYAFGFLFLRHCMHLRLVAILTSVKGEAETHFEKVSTFISNATSLHKLTIIYLEREDTVNKPTLKRIWISICMSSKDSLKQQFLIILTDPNKMKLYMRNTKCAAKFIPQPKSI